MIMRISTGLRTPPPETTSSVTPWARQASATVTAVSRVRVTSTSSGSGVGTASQRPLEEGRWKCSLPVLFGTAALR